MLNKCVKCGKIMHPDWVPPTCMLCNDDYLYEFYKCQSCGWKFEAKRELNYQHCPECSSRDIIVDEKTKISWFMYACGIGICPACGNKLIVKEGTYGLFVGCSSFPNCKYTESIRKVKKKIERVVHFPGLKVLG